MTEQIYYNYWGTQSEEHNDYFYTIGTIAQWIGYALIGPAHRPYTTDIVTRSNISVLQTKEKFGTPRVYVSFKGDTHLEDAVHYRHVYKTAINLFPQYERAIRDGMDYSEYLIDTEEELEKFFTSRTEWVQRAKLEGEISNEDYLSRISTVKEEIEFIKKVCGLA